MFIAKVGSKFLFSTLCVLLLAQHILGHVIYVPEKADTDVETTSSEMNSKTFSTDADASFSVIKANSAEQIEEYNSHPTSTKNSQSTLKYFTDDLITFNLDLIDEFLNASLSPLEKFFENITSEVVANESTHQKYLQEQIEFWKQYLSKLREYDDEKDAIFKKYDLFEDIAESLDAFLNATLVEESSSEEDAFFEQLLPKYNFTTLIKELDDIAKNYMKTFKEKSNGFWQQLPVDERGELDFDEWFEDFEQEGGLFECFSLFRIQKDFVPHPLFIKRKAH